MHTHVHSILMYVHVCICMCIYSSWTRIYMPNWWNDIYRNTWIFWSYWISKIVVLLLCFPLDFIPPIRLRPTVNDLPVRVLYWLCPSLRPSIRGFLGLLNQTLSRYNTITADNQDNLIMQIMIQIYQLIHLLKPM